MSKIESKIKSAEDWYIEILDAMRGKTPFTGIFRIMKAAQRQAIEVALKVVADRAEIIHNVDSDYLPYIDQESILSLKDSPELKVI